MEKKYGKPKFILHFFLFIFIIFFVLRTSITANAESNQTYIQSFSTEEALLNRAKAALYTRHFSEGMDILDSLNGYSYSNELREYITNYIQTEPVFKAPLLDDKYIDYVFNNGKIYSLTTYGLATEDFNRYKGLVYIPNKVSETTTFVQYFCGGGDGGDYLWYPGVEEYFQLYSPNAIIVFTTESGSTRIDERISWQWDVLQHIAFDCGLIIHDLAAVGSSNGAYTAIKLSYAFYSEHGLKTSRVITLDTGMCWTLSNLFLSFSELQTVAAENTTFYAFEADDFMINDINTEYPQNILLAGIELIPVICSSGGHSMISENAYHYGLFNFAAGENIYIPSYEYTPVDIYAEMGRSN